jgi:regulatory protein
MLRQRLKPEPLRKSEADPAVVRKKHSAPELLDELPDDSDAHLADPVAVRKKAMDFLARREYGRGELENKLCKAGFDAEAVAKALAHLTDEGLQSDERFAESFMQSRINQGKGPVRIRLDLQERGLHSSLIDAVLENCAEDWFRLARAVRQRKFGATLPSDFKERARQMRFLQYRGFEMPHIQAAFGDHGIDG